MNLLGFRWAGLAMAVAMAMGASVDVSRGTRGAGLCVSSGSPYQARGLGLVVSSDVNILGAKISRVSN